MTTRASSASARVHQKASGVGEAQHTETMGTADAIVDKENGDIET